MTGSRLDRNSVFFRFASEGNVVEKVEFSGREIAVGDLKQAIAERKSLPKFDLVLVNEATNEVYERDGAMLLRNVRVTVRRTPLQSSRKPALVTIDGEDVWDKMQEQSGDKQEARRDEPIQRRACPAAYLCPLCCNIFKNPSIARCCGRSACSTCFADSTSDSCPLCSKPWVEETKPIHNPRLADSVASLNLEYFVLPKEAALKVEESSQPQDISLQPTSAAAPVLSPRVAGPELVPAAAPVSQPPWLPPGLLPPGATLRPCMLTPEQFHNWQQSQKCDRDTSSSESERRKLRRRKSKDQRHEKKKKKQKA
eukprot:CAMPEP_0172843040 /NCGR_PEP_ID=MMETSP1075-20121228/31174_1 /TAXON_ID=2916 /ORGANISM="Ceratium fusus, Strain PA161109" /LENGTH=310 /DNA_ID=CAMNT_0013687251 /DNA_START=80 /DNA_END=1012 /DNA_ORIENTATION=+